jgi:hypothetical protein
VEPKKRPDEITDEHFTFHEKEAMIKYLIGYQKTQADWDDYRKKIPDELLQKWARILLEARENGFFNPRVINGQYIIWKQIVGFKRNYKSSDECTLCPKTFVSGECQGKMKHDQHGHRVFRPCWYEPIPAVR